MRSRIGSVLCVFGLLVALTGCGGGDGGGSDITPPPTSGTPPPPPPPPPPTIGEAGGTVTENGATVVVPAGALGAEVTIRLAMDSTGAPALPSELTAAGNMYAITPHGGEFSAPVEVSIPVPSVTLQPTQQFRLAKAQPGGQWELLDTQISDGKLKAKVGSFSFFIGVVIDYTLPLAQAVPLAFTTTIDCGGQDCNLAVG